MVELRIYQYSMLHRCIFRLQNQSLFPIRSRLSEGKPHEYLKKLMKMKSKRTKQMIIIMPLCIFWFVWTIFEIMQSIPMTSYNFHKVFFEGSMIGGIIGSICGIIYAFRLYRKIQHTNDEVISQINNLIKDE